MGTWWIHKYDGAFEVYDSILNGPAFHADTLEEAVAICERHGKRADYVGELSERA